MSIIATIIMADNQEMTFELFEKQAPISVSNFCSLAQSGFFNGLTFHRVVKDYVIQGGAFDNTCNCPSDFCIKGEFAENGVDTGLTHNRGALSMARDDGFDTAGTQFFITHKDANKLDRRYGAFGMIIKGFDVLDEIANTPTLSPQEENRPITPQVIRSITIALNGAVLPTLERIPSK